MAAVTPQRGYPFQTVDDAPAGHLLGENLAMAVDADMAVQIAAIAALQARVTALEALAILRSFRASDSAPVNNSTVPVTTGLSVTLPAASVYVVATDVSYSSATGPDVNFSWTIPAGATISWDIWGLGVGVATFEGDVKTEVRASASPGISAGGAGTGTRLSARPASIITTGATGGAATLMFAQNSAVASDTVVHAGSWMVGFRLA